MGELRSVVRTWVLRQTRLSVIPGLLHYERKQRQGESLEVSVTPTLLAIRDYGDQETLSQGRRPGETPEVI